MFSVSNKVGTLDDGLHIRDYVGLLDGLGIVRNDLGTVHAGLDVCDYVGRLPDGLAIFKTTWVKKMAVMSQGMVMPNFGLDNVHDGVITLDDDLGDVPW